MSLKNGNELFRAGKYSEAIDEYKKIKSTDRNFDSAKFNISLAQKRKAVSSEGREASAEFSKNLELQESSASPKLSIVMPVFNVAPYLDTSIVSALSQKYQNFELIIVNDASTDNGKKIIEMHQSQDSRIKFIDIQSNTLGGAGIPSNFGIDAAAGEYIAFIDSDDWVRFDAFFSLMQKAIQHNADIVIGDFCTFLDDSRVVSRAYDHQIWSKLPKDQIISIKNNPELFHLSPVPWRKIYKKKFLMDYGIKYPEGDYFYEDNPLHWFVLSKAERVVVTDCLVSYHRMAREGQTMGASTYKLSAVCAHLNTIFNFIQRIQGELREVVFTQFYDYWYRTDWIVNRQPNNSFEQKIIKKQMANIYHRANAVFPLKTTRTTFAQRVSDYSSAYPDMDLTIVVSTHNSPDALKQCLGALLKIYGLKCNVIIIDNDIDVASSKVLDDYKNKGEYKNIHVLKQKYRGDGRARNSVIPMCTGKYVLFLDEQSIINPDELLKAYIRAIEKKSDILFFKCSTELLDRKNILRSYVDDEDLWVNVKDGDKSISLKMNYSLDNKLVKTQYLHDSNIFFGPSTHFNKLGFHWCSSISAEKIDFYPNIVSRVVKKVIKNSIPPSDSQIHIELFDELFAMRKFMESKGVYQIKSNFFKEIALKLIKSVEDYVPLDKQNDVAYKKQELLK